MNPGRLPPVCGPKMGGDDQRVKPGEKVASSANFLIDSEAKLKGISQQP